MFIPSKCQCVGDWNPTCDTHSVYNEVYCETCGEQIEDNGSDFCSYECAAQPVSAN